MNYIIRLFALLLIMAFSPIRADDASFADFIVGHYLLVGQGIETESTYSGTVSIYLENKQLKVKRTIDGNVTNGVAIFKVTLNGDSKVLRINFSENNVNYEETCLWISDLDNYARISCYLYTPGVKTRKPGMEVLFIDHSLN